MAQANRILIWALALALLVIALRVALLFVDITAAAEKNAPSGKIGVEITSLEGRRIK